MSNKNQNVRKIDRIPSGTIIRIPPALEPDLARVLSVKDLNKVSPSSKGKVSVVELEGLEDGIWRGTKVTVHCLSETLCEIVELPEEERPSLIERFGAWFANKGSAALSWGMLVLVGGFVLSIIFSHLGVASV